jgi:hypothetical protein
VLSIGSLPQSMHCCADVCGAGDRALRCACSSQPRARQWSALGCDHAIHTIELHPTTPPINQTRLAISDRANIDWLEYDRWNARMRSASRRAANMKHPWDMHLTTEYVQRVFSQGDGMCRCGKAKETSDHVLHSYLCPANTLGREQTTHHMHSSIRSLEAEGELSPDWCWFRKQLFGLTIQMEAQIRGPEGRNLSGHSGPNSSRSTC